MKLVRDLIPRIIEESGKECDYHIADRDEYNTELFKKMIAKNWPTSVFPIREYWVDVGQISDLEKANKVII